MDNGKDELKPRVCINWFVGPDISKQEILIESRLMDDLFASKPRFRHLVSKARQTGDATEKSAPTPTSSLSEVQPAKEAPKKSEKIACMELDDIDGTKIITSVENAIFQAHEETAAETVHQDKILQRDESSAKPSELLEETTDVEHVIQQAEQIMIQEFSFEETSFPACDLSALNLSFNSNCTDPLGADIPSCDQPKENTVAENSHTGLFTLAYISDLAEKLEVAKLDEAPKSDADTSKPNKIYFTTPSQAKNSSLSHLYSPISPADLSSQYLDAVDDSVVEKYDGPSNLTAEAIDAIVLLQEKLRNSEKNKCEPKSEHGSEPSEISAEKSAFVSALMQDSDDTSMLTANNSEVKSNSDEIVENPEFVSAAMHQDEKIETSEEGQHVSQENVKNDVSLLQENSLCNEDNIQDISQISLQSSASDASHQQSNTSLLNDTIDEMDLILSMGVSYLETRNESSSHVDTPRPTSKIQDNRDENRVPQEESRSAMKFFPTPQLKKFDNITEPVTALNTHDDKLVFPSNTHAEPSTARGYHAHSHGKKLFNTPIGLKTPGITKSDQGAKSAGFRSKTDVVKSLASSSPFLAANSAESANFKQPLSGVRSFKKFIQSPVSQYIKGPVMAPRFTVVRPKSPLPPAARQTGKQTKNNFMSPQQTDTENISPNIAAINLPRVDYDSTSSIKVVEQLERKQKPLPSSIKKLLPSTGSVVKHFGRVNIPESVDGRQEVSILVSHDAIN